MSLAGIRLALRAAFRRGAVESEMEKEMRLHLDLEIEANVRRGMSPAEARRVALLAFGGLDRAKEATRDERSTWMLEQLVIDLRYALRGIRHRPMFTAAIIGLLALGIGANTAIFSVINEKLLQPFPVPNGDRMVSLVVTAGNGQYEFGPPPALLAAWKSRARLVESIITYRWSSDMMGDTTRSPRRDLYGLEVSHGAMAFVSMRPALGRDFLPTDTLMSGPPVVMLSDKVWRTDFGARRDVIGSTTLLGGRPHTVIGVAPPEFIVPFVGIDVAFYKPARFEPNARGVSAIAMLRPGHSLEEASREASSLKNVITGPGPVIDPPVLRDGTSLIRPVVKRIALLLFGAVGVVLLIACANVANLLLARTWSRQREFAVRGAMGASRSRIARQLFTENLLLSLAGGLAGFALGAALVKLIVIVQPDNVGFAGRIDGRVLGWAMVLSVVAGAILAIAPAAMIGDGRLSEMLKSTARSATSSIAARRLRSTLVVAEVALSVVLLVGSGLLMRTITAMQHADVGLNPTGLASITLQLRGKTFAQEQARHDALTAIFARLSQMPGITSVAGAFTAPPDFAVSLRGDMEIEGRPANPLDSLRTVTFNRGTKDLFRVAGLRFIEGRPYDMAAGNTEVVINDDFARRFWPNGAIGHRVKIDSVWTTIVGVVATTIVPGEEGPSRLQHYRPFASVPARLELIVRSPLPAPALQSLLENAIKEAAPGAGSARFRVATDRYVAARAVHRFTLGLVGAFAATALLLAGIGLAAVIGYSVSQRTQEIGIRVALGAPATEVAGLVVRQGVVLAGVGIVLGSVAGLAATQVMRSMLFGVSPDDPVTISAVAMLLFVVALIACVVPARRATRVDPLVMLRAD